VEIISAEDSLLVQRVLAVFKPLQLMVEVESRERSNPPWNR